MIALLAEPSLARAAAYCGIGERTLNRWLREPDFRSAYRQARREAFSHAIALTQRYSPLAVQTLAKVMSDDKAPHSARVQAAASLLRFGRDGIELEDLQERLEALEAQMAPQDKAEGGMRQDRIARLERASRRAGRHRPVPPCGGPRPGYNALVLVVDDDALPAPRCPACGLIIDAEGRARAAYPLPHDRPVVHQVVMLGSAS